MLELQHAMLDTLLICHTFVWNLFLEHFINYDLSSQTHMLLKWCCTYLKNVSMENVEYVKITKCLSCNIPCYWHVLNFKSFINWYFSLLIHMLVKWFGPFLTNLFMEIVYTKLTLPYFKILIHILLTYCQ